MLGASRGPSPVGQVAREGWEEQVPQQELGRQTSKESQGGRQTPSGLGREQGAERPSFLERSSSLV